MAEIMAAIYHSAIWPSDPGELFNFTLLTLCNVFYHLLKFIFHFVLNAAISPFRIQNAV